MHINITSDDRHMLESMETFLCHMPALYANVSVDCVCVFYTSPLLLPSVFACARIQEINFVSMINKSEARISPPPSEDFLYGYEGTNIIDLPCSASVDAKFPGLIHRLKNLQGKASSAIHSMQLAKNNNAMWRVISNGDQPLPHLLRRPDLNKYTKKVNLRPKRRPYHQKSCVDFKSCLTSNSPDQWKC